MKVVNFHLNEISPYQQLPNKPWFEKEYGDRFGSILFEFCLNPNFEIFENNKKIISENLSNNRFYFKLRKLFYLSHEWLQHKKWNNPIIVTNRNGNFIVHPGQDRYNIMKAHNVETYDCYFIEPEEASLKNISKIKKLFNNDGEVVFNEKHFILKNYKVENIHFHKWLNNDITIEQI
jgi:hypothetical protein